MRKTLLIFLIIGMCGGGTQYLQAQVDKPNEKFDRVWDGGKGGFGQPPKTISRSWEIEAGWDIDKDGKTEFAAFDADDYIVYLWESHGNGDNQYDQLRRHELRFCL